MQNRANWRIEINFDPILNKIAACTAERVFRLDKAQEHLHYVMDVAGDELLVLDTPALPQTPEDEGIENGIRSRTTPTPTEDR